MSSEGNFLTYCVEQYKYDKNLTGRQTMALFEKYKVLEYIYTCCEPLSDGKSYITEDIDLYIEACEKTENISPALLKQEKNTGKDYRIHLSAMVGRKYPQSSSAPDTTRENPFLVRTLAEA